jgi:hypothetical protein
MPMKNKQFKNSNTSFVRLYGYKETTTKTKKCSHWIMRRVIGYKNNCPIVYFITFFLIWVHTHCAKKGLALGIFSERTLSGSFETWKNYKSQSNTFLFNFIYLLCFRSPTSYKKKTRNRGIYFFRYTKMGIKKSPVHANFKHFHETYNF